MRLPLILALTLLAPTSLAQPASGVLATLTIDVAEDHAEAMRLEFDGLRRLTQYNGICLPQGAVESRVYDALGNVTYTSTEEGGRRALTFTARSETITIEMARSGPAATDHPLYSSNANFCVPANSRVVVNVHVPAGHKLFFMTDGGSITNGGRSGTTSSDGPTHVFYSYEAPIGSAPLQVFDEGAFRIFAAPELAQHAREVVGLAAEPYDAALDEAGLSRPFDTLRVLFVNQTPFTWEAGHYNGQGYVTVKDSTLVRDASAGYPYAGVKVLVHEAFHAASFPYGKGPVTDNLAWWLEGSARHSERQVDRAMPNATLHCETTGAEVKCWSFDDRISRAELENGYAASFAFDPSWEPSLPQDDDTRRFYYGFSEYVVGAWIQQNGESRYRETWDKVTAAFENGTSCPCAEGWLETLLQEDDIFRPWADVRANDSRGFDARVRPFVKDEQALQDALDARANPFAGLGVPFPLALGLIGAAAVAALIRRPMVR